MAGYLRLQDTLTVAANDPQTQEREFAADVGQYKTISVQVQVMKAATAGSLVLQHAAVNEESAYRSIGGVSIDLTTTTGGEPVIEAPLRFLRWKLENLNGDVSFLVDLVAREY